MADKLSAVDMFFRRVMAHHDIDDSVKYSIKKDYETCKIVEESQHFETFSAGITATEDHGKSFDQYYKTKFKTK